MNSFDKSFAIVACAVCFTIAVCAASCGWVHVAEQHRLGGCK